jgi:hypothetical protein
VGIYRLLSGRHRRFEDGRLCEYIAGDLVELSEREVRRLRQRIKAIGSTAAKAAPAPEPRAVFTPGDTKSLTVRKLKTVIANVQEPAQLDDIEEREAANEKPRVTVFRAIEERRAKLDEE